MLTAASTRCRTTTRVPPAEITEFRNSGTIGVVTTSGQSLYEAVGGAATFEKLVHRFYLEVKDDEVLRPLYPEEDLTGAERRLRMFLEQYWGGPQTYSSERGHPRLRMRHIPF